MDVYLWTGDDGLFVPGASVTKPHEAAQRLDAQCTCIQCSAVQGDQIGMISNRLLLLLEQSAPFCPKKS